MNRLITAATLAACLVACASVTESPVMRVTPPSANGEGWLESVKASPGLTSDTVTLSVNGSTVASGSR